MHEDRTELAPADDRRRRGAAAVLLAMTLLAATFVVSAVAATPASAQGCAPRIAVSRTSNLASGGETVSVSGSCFDVNKGIYVAFCVVPPPGAAPSPCGGGVDMTGAGGLSHWISSNPPDYGQGVAVPYGAGGSFNVTMTPSATLNPTVDCRRVSCAIVTRNDHTRASDRSQDVIIPVSFAADAVALPPPPPPVELPPPPPPSLAPETTTTAAPETTTTVAEATSTTAAASAGTDGATELAADPASAEGGSGSNSTGLVVLLVAVVALVVAGGGWLAIRRKRSSPAAP